VKGVQPIRDKSGNLLSDKAEIEKAWCDHYQSLAADVTGHSKDEDYWKSRVEDWGLPAMEELDRD
jgi:hypothetical protein